MNTALDTNSWHAAQRNSSLTEWQKKFEQSLLSSTFDGAHDIGHLRRVWTNFLGLAKDEESVCLLTGMAASYFHDFVLVPKNGLDRSSASQFAAKKAIDHLRGLNFPSEKLENVYHCIVAHSYSANIKAETIEAKLISDADKLDALGSIGLARLFYTAGSIGSMLFHPFNPIPATRDIDEKLYAVDHYYEKLQSLDSRMYTRQAVIEARTRIAYMQVFIDDMVA